MRLHADRCLKMAAPTDDRRGARRLPLSRWTLLSALIAGGCGTLPPSPAPEQRHEFTRPQMGVPFRIVLYAPDPGTAQAAAEAAFARVSELNDLLSDYDPDSELSRLSRSSGGDRAVPVSPDLWRVLVRAQALAVRSEGAFDATVGPVVNLWRKARRERKLPSPANLEEARARVGHDKLVLDPARRTAHLRVPDMRLDLGGIAKGYAVDEALATLRARGIRRALVSGGGDLAVSEPPPGQPGWRIELAPPDLAHAPPAEFLWLKHAALATSGDTFQRLELDGRRYSHIVDPRTGIGLTDHSLVTVIARDCLTADSLATAVSVLGPVRGLPLVEATAGAAARVWHAPDEQLERHESRRFSRRRAQAQATGSN